MSPRLRLSLALPIAAGLVVLSLLLTACSGITSKPKPVLKGGAPVPLEEEEVVEAVAREANSAMIGHLKITITYAGVGTVYGKYDGRINNFRSLYCKVVAENTSAVKVIEWEGLQSEFDATDEHGNKFRPVSFEGWQFDYVPFQPDNSGPTVSESGPITDARRAIHPGKTVAAFSFWKHAPASSKQLRLAVPRKLVEGGGDGVVHLSLPIDHR